MAKVKVTPNQLKALAVGLDGRQGWANPVTVEINGDILRYYLHSTGEVREVVGIRPMKGG